MKRILLVCLSALILVTAVSGCSANSGKSGKLNIVTTIFPIYDWTKEIAGDKADVSPLVDDGVDMHSFQPSAEDIVKISSCDVFIYIGGESDGWVDDALKEKVNKDMTVINLLDVLGNSAKEEKAVEGMEKEKPGDEEEPELDEHIWLSLKNAKTLCGYIAEKLGRIDSANKKTYEKNASAYSKKLDTLDKAYEKAVKASDKKTVVFGDRFPFMYLAEDYGLRYYAAFKGCSAETEASFNTIAFLADKVDKNNLKAIFKLETSDGKIAETVKSNTKSKNQKILTLNSMQSKTDPRSSYVSVMTENLEVLKQGL